MDKNAIVRIVIFILVWLNQYLVSKGQAPLPVLNEAEISGVITFLVSVWTLIKNNKVKK